MARKFDLEKWQTFWKLHGLPDSLKVLPMLSKRAMVRRLHAAERLPPDELLQAALASCGAGDVLGRFRRFRKQFSLETRMFACTQDVDKGQVVQVFDPHPKRGKVKSALARQIEVRNNSVRVQLGLWDRVPDGGMLIEAGITFQFNPAVAMPIFASSLSGTANVLIFGQEVVWRPRKKMVTIKLKGKENAQNFRRPS